MTVVLDDSVGTSTANSYDSVAFADDYLAASPYATAWAAKTSDEKAVLLIRSTRQLDVLPYPSLRTTSTQALSFPRVGVYTDSGTVYDASGSLPLCLKQATALLAGWLASRRAGEQDPFGNDPSQNIASLAVGPLDIELREGAPLPGVDFVKRTIWPLLARGGLLSPLGRVKLVR